MIAIVLDLIVAAILILMVFIGVKRGFIKSAVGLIGTVAAIVAAAIFCRPIAEYVFDMWLKTPLQTLVSDTVAQGVAATAATVTEQVNAVVASLPKAVQGALAIFGLGELSADAALPAEQLTTVVMDDVLAPICISLVQVIVFLLLFIAVAVIIRLLGGALDKLFASLPVIKQANGLLGGVIGLAEGVLIVFVLTLVVQLYMTFTGADSVVTMQDIENTYLFRLATEWNPLW